MSSNGAQATCPSRKDISNYLHAVYKQVLRVGMGVLIEVWGMDIEVVCAEVALIKGDVYCMWLIQCSFSLFKVALPRKTPN